MFLLNGLGKEIQEANSLCWAAVSTMAVRAFPEEGEFKHPDQRKTVIYRESDIRNLAQLRHARDSTGEENEKFVGFTKACEEKGSCNFTSVELHMFDVESTKVPEDHALLPEHFFIEIALRKCPVPIRWRYKGEISVNGRKRRGDHALIVTGYNPATNELRVFDPWPAPTPNDGIPDLLPEQHEKWIPYSVYLDPQRDHGLDAVARHEFDEYMLRRFGDTTDLATKFGYPPPVKLSPRLVRPENSIDFSRQGIPDDLNDAIRKVMAAHVVRDSSGNVIHGPYDAGRPIPIVALEVSKILDAAAALDPSRLFKSDTSTVAVPVLRNGKMIDSYTMLHDTEGWRPGGYCNNRIASLLVQAREVLGERPGEPVYLVSVPELSLFFVAHGYFGSASLAGLSLNALRNLRGCAGMVMELVESMQREVFDLTSLRRTLGSSLF
jgi:hypothetical protein